MKDLKVTLGRAIFRNPVFGASGCSGHGFELQRHTDLSKYGAVSLKTVTYRARHGNPPARIAEVTGGIITSVGLQNKGPDDYLNEIMPPVISTLDKDQIVVSVAGDTVEEYVELCERFAERYGDKIQAMELNAACPNATKGIGFFSRDPGAAQELITAVKKAVDLPILYKFNTNFENYTEVGKAISDAGVDAIYTTNTPLGLKLDIKTKTPVLGNTVGPLCGPVVKPIGLLRIWNLFQVVDAPLIASGGVSCAEDVIEYIIAGASAVGVGTMQFRNPMIIPKIVADLEVYLEKEKLDSLQQLTGAAQRN